MLFFNCLYKAILVKIANVHEAALAESVIEYLLKYEKEQFFRIEKVVIEVGKASGVSLDSLKFCLEEVTKAIYKDWTFEFIETPLTIKCNSCGGEFEVDSINFMCSQCGEPDIEAVSGFELNILELEGEPFES